MPFATDRRSARDKTSADSNVPAVARLFRSEDGGPVRRILNGRRSSWTGTFNSQKAGWRAMPWESAKGEYPILGVCELSTGVSKLLAQPMRLEIPINEQRRPLVYFPDLEIEVDAQFVEGLQNGVGFVDVAAQVRRDLAAMTHPTKVALEIKTENDPRNDDVLYEDKLAMAKNVLARFGIKFFKIDRVSHFPDERLVPFRQLLSIDRNTKITLADYEVLRRLYSSKDYHSYATVSAALGGNVLGDAKMLAFQIRRTISIDLSKPITPRSAVFIVR